MGVSRNFVSSAWQGLWWWVVAHLDARIPQTGADLAALLEQAGELLAAAKGHDEHVDLVSPLLLLLESADDGENAVDAEADADARHLRLAGEHAHEVVVPAAGGDRPYIVSAREA